MTAVASTLVVIDGSILSMKGLAATISGKHISLGSSAVVVGDSVVLFPISSLSRRELHHLCEHINRLHLMLSLA